MRPPGLLGLRLPAVRLSALRSPAVRLPAVRLPASAPDRPWRVGRDVVLPAASVLALGPIVGVVWWLLAPTGPVLVGPDYLLPVVAGTAGVPGDVYSAAQDAAFAAAALVAGAVCGLAAGVRPPPGRAALVRWGSVVTAGLVAPVLAWALGTLLGPASVAAQQAAGAAQVFSPLRLSSPASLLLWSAATCVVAFAGSLVSLLVDPPGDA